MSWLVYAILSAFFAGLVAILGKIGVQGIGNTVATTVRAIIMALLLTILMFVRGAYVQTPTSTDGPSYSSSSPGSLEVNSARIKNDFEDRLTESRRHLEREMRNALHGLIVATDTAVNETRRLHAAGAAAVNARFEEIEKLELRLDRLERRDQEESAERLA